MYGVVIWKICLKENRKGTIMKKNNWYFIFLFILCFIHDIWNIVKFNAEWLPFDYILDYSSHSINDSLNFLVTPIMVMINIFKLYINLNFLLFCIFIFLLSILYFVYKYRLLLYNFLYNNILLIIIFMILFCIFIYI